MNDEPPKGCLCYTKKTKGEFPKTFKSSSKILRKYKNNDLEISDDVILEVMIRLYVSENKQKSIAMLQRCRINPNFEMNSLRNDLEYYIPQLINFMVFHQQLQDPNLIQFVLKASTIDFFFAHLVYFQLKSLSQIITPNETVTFTIVKRFIDSFFLQMSQTYSGSLLIATHILQIKLEESNLLESSRGLSPQRSSTQQVYQGSVRIQSFKKNEYVQAYGTKQWNQILDQKTINLFLIKHHNEIELQDYQSIFEKQEQKIDTAFLSNISFWNDIMRICDELTKVKKKTEFLQICLQKINENLPAAVYVPFVNGAIRNYAILKVVPKESRVFSTKTRTPFSLTLEIFRPEIEGTKNQHLIEKQLSKAIMASNKFVSERTQSQFLKEDQVDYIEQRRRTFSSADAQKSMINDFQQIKFYQINFQAQEQMPEGTSQFYALDDELEEVDQKPISQPSSNYSLEENVQPFSIENESNISSNKKIDQEKELEISRLKRTSYLQSDRGIILTIEEQLEMKATIFGENSLTQSERIKSQSIFQKLQTWRLIHLIIKTGDNLKQEQFALQLISQFDQIFKKEGLPLKLRYYEVLSMGPDCGIIEMIKNATTIDSLQKNLQKKYTQFKDFSDFFRSFFRNNIDQALQNYVQSLAAYSLICYFLQVKDRHNGNILIDSEGHLIHIDFGFFLSIAPGKGMEFEGKVPFKLLSDYITVLGGAQGVLFQENFRRLFYKGFKACQKHQKEILLLVEMMYTGHGTTLPCFQKGEQTLRDLEKRFNPKVASDAELFVYVQELINKSLDNWRARWYDKFQYFAQGIFY